MEFKPSLPPLPEKKEAKEPLSFPEEMYTVSGFLPPSSRHYEKGERYDEQINAIAEQLLPLRNAWWEDAYSTTARISQAFKSPVESIQLTAVHALDSLRQAEITKILKENTSLFLSNQNLFNAVTENIRDSYFLGEASDFFVSATLASDLPTSQKIHLVENLHESSSIIQILEDAALSDEIIAAAIHRLKRLSQEDRTKYIKKFVLSDSELIKSTVIGELRHLPPNNNQSSLIREALLSTSPLIRTAALAQIEYLPPQERVIFIEQALLSDDEMLRCIAIDQMIGNLPTDEVIKQLQDAIHSQFPSLQKKTIEYLELFDAEQQQTLAQWVFDSQNEDLMIVLSQQISHLSPNYGIRRQIIEQGLMHTSVRIHWFFAHQVKHLSEKDRLELLEDTRFTEALTTSPLYKNSSLSSENFGRDAFEKTGSKTTLLGGALKNKLILRHILPDTFVAWKKAFEAYPTWQELGFDYVPIEPIQTYHLSQNGFVNTASGVLDIDYDNWQRRFPMLFTDSLKEQKDAINKGLKLLGVDHGHAHDTNFVLRFFRDENGLPDLSKTPRLYIIDFDEAKSEHNNVNV